MPLPSMFQKKPLIPQPAAYPAAPANGFQYQDPMANLGEIDRIKYLQKNNPEALMSLAAGLMSGNMAEGFAGAGSAMSDYRKNDMKRQEEASARDQAKQFYLSQGLTEAEANAAATNSNIGSSMLNRQELERKYQLAQEYPDASGGGDGGKIFGNPINMVGPNGEFGVAFAAKDGSGLIMGGQPLPQGWRELSPYETSFGRGVGTDSGKNYAEVEKDLTSMQQYMPHLRETAGKLKDLAKKATYTVAGQGRDWLGNQVGITTDGATARTSFQTMADNVILPSLRQTFGAQFTAAEGQSLKALLGDADLSPEQKAVAIENFIEQKEAELLAKKGEADAYKSSNPYAQTAPTTTGAPASGGEPGGWGEWQAAPNGNPQVRIRRKN